MPNTTFNTLRTSRKRNIREVDAVPLWNSEQDSNVNTVYGPDQNICIPGHTSVMRGQSAYFDKMFDNGTKKIKLDPEDDEHAVTAMLHYMYHAEYYSLDHNHETPKQEAYFHLDVYDMSGQYEMKALQKAAMRHFLQVFDELEDPELIWEFIVYRGKVHGHQDLMQSWAEKHLDKLIDLPAFEDWVAGNRDYLRKMMKKAVQTQDFEEGLLVNCSVCSRTSTREEVPARIVRGGTDSGVCLKCYEAGQHTKLSARQLERGRRI